MHKKLNKNYHILVCQKDQGDLRDIREIHFMTTSENQRDALKNQIQIHLEKDLTILCIKI